MGEKKATGSVWQIFSTEEDCADSWMLNEHSVVNLCVHVRPYWKYSATR